MTNYPRRCWFDNIIRNWPAAGAQLFGTLKKTINPILGTLKAKAVALFGLKITFSDARLLFPYLTSGCRLLQFPNYCKAHIYCGSHAGWMRAPLARLRPRLDAIVSRNFIDALFHYALSHSLNWKHFSPCADCVIASGGRRAPLMFWCVAGVAKNVQKKRRRCTWQILFQVITIRCGKKGNFTNWAR